MTLIIKYIHIFIIGIWAHMTFNYQKLTLMDGFTLWQETGNSI
ncbi:hypothetical protein WJM97_15525 [Okeanomitos corallinicola TIOX110]|uniref:Uncharacterized protein n=1 Tax=Okeanomitos corallinicola TIOX110 TaxID=3133117 RepID=A0ABZ2UN51_9CYAN